MTALPLKVRRRLRVSALLADAATVARRAAAMGECEAIEITTWTDEPELLAEPGEPIPVFTALEIAAARLRCDAIPIPEWPGPSLIEFPTIADCKRELAVRRLKAGKPGWPC